MIYLSGKQSFHSLNWTEIRMLGPTLNMAQEDPSKAAVVLERTVRASKNNHIMNFLKGHRRIHEFVTIKRCSIVK